MYSQKETFLDTGPCTRNAMGPSRTSRQGGAEGQGLAFGEAMMAGIPVIASRIGGIMETVRHEETGLLVPERAPDEIAAAVERLVREPSLADRLTKAGHELASTKFTRSASAMAFSELFGTLLQARSG